MILGLDISTTMVGCAVINSQLIRSENWDLSKCGTTFDKAELVGAELYALRSEYNIEHIFIETAFFPVSLVQTPS